jgi:hypothetical protein
VKVVENFRGYEPSVRVVASVGRLIESVPEEYLHGLGAIVLTNRSALNHRRRRSKTRSRGKRVAIDRTAGFYHQAWQGEPAWIEIFLDGALEGLPVLLRRVALIREMFLAEILFHELGHHIHKTRRPEYREREDVADDWARRLSRAYFRRHYWYLRPIAVLVHLPVRAARVVWRKAKKG